MDFYLRPVTDCNDDCTQADGKIHKDCDGKNGCEFCSVYDSINSDIHENAKNICDGQDPGWTRDYDYKDESCSSPPCEIICAEGCPVEKSHLEATVTCEDGNLIKLTKLITYKGKLTRLVVAVCG